jgi:hypothetical protein
MSESLDEVHARRARIARWAALGKRVGYTGLLVSIAAFVAGIASDFPGWLVTVCVVGLAVSIVVLPLPIVIAYGVRAAEVEERGGRFH